eukprot:6460888-Amphidinium_carterae.1
MEACLAEAILLVLMQNKQSWLEGLSTTFDKSWPGSIRRRNTMLLTSCRGMCGAQKCACCKRVQHPSYSIAKAFHPFTPWRGN